MSKYLIVIGLSLFFIQCRQNQNTKKNIDFDLFAGMDTINIKTYGMGNSRLSEYGFFEGRLADLVPGDRVIPYELNAPLFSDYAFKERFVYFPEGEKGNYNDSEVLDFPLGTILIKNFIYPDNFNNADSKRRIIETRLLKNEGTFWRPISYIWNEEQTEAYFILTGKEIPISWTFYDGKEVSIDYAVPDINQCKNCHAFNKKTAPIGPSARQLNKDIVVDGNTINQLSLFEPYISGIPPDGVTRLADYNNSSLDIHDRARAYLDINCGNCHRPEGSAKTSGLDLSIHQSEEYKLGIHKAPIAAGKASGGRLSDIVPGHPDQSILLYRMESTDPEIMMPEMGRKLVHQEGVALIREWIASL